MIFSISRKLLALNFLVFLLNFFCCSSLFSEENNGQDFTKPVTRLDFRYKYTKIRESKREDTLILRSDKRYNLNNDWILTTRFDLPYLWSLGDGEDGYYDYYSYQNSSSFKTQGIGDLLFQALIIPPSIFKWTFAFGLRATFPTAKKELGSGKYCLLPTFAVKYDLKDWMKGAWCAILVRQEFDVAGKKSREHIERTYIQPYFNIDLPQHYFITFSPEMKYDWKSHRWFIPFDILIGKLIHKKWVVSFEYKNAIVDDFPQYKQEIELRVGYIF